jgi:hypothetical protein
MGISRAIAPSSDRRRRLPMYDDPHVHREPIPAREPDGGLAGYAAIKYTAIVIIVLAVLAFLIWALTRFFG